MTKYRVLTKRTSLTFIASIAIAAVAPTTQVFAQDGGLTLEEIVVTAQRRAQSLQEVPIAIEVFSGEEIRKQGFRDLDDLANFSPTVLIEPRTQDQDVAIRGFGTTGNTLTHDQAAPFFVDGIHFGRQSQVKLAFMDVESLEVLKGPQPVYFGQNATAGAFNIRSRRPTESWEGYINAEFASDATNELTFGIGGPINDKWGIRVAGTHETSEGYLDYVVTGAPYGAYENNGGRVTLQYTPNDRLTVTGKVDIAKIRKDSETFYTCLTDGPIIFGRGGPLDDPNDDPGNELSVWNQEIGTPWGQPFTPLDTDCFSSNKGTSQGGPYFDPPPGIRQFSGNTGFVDMRVAADAFAKTSGNNGILGYEDLDAVNTILEFEYEFENEMSLLWLNGTSDYERDYVQDNRNGPFFTNFQGRGEDFSQFSSELRLRSAANRAIEWEVGAFFQNTDLTAFSSSLRANVRQSQRFNDITEEVDFSALFGTVTFNFMDDKMSLDIGGRFQDVDKFATVEGHAASWVFAVCPEDPCDLDPAVNVASNLTFDPVLDGYNGDAGSVDGDAYYIVDPASVRLYVPVPAGTTLYAMPFRETRNVPVPWNAGNAIPVGLSARDFAVRVDRNEGPYAQRFTESEFSPQVTLRFRPTDNMSIYARYAESSKIGGFDTGQSSIPTSIDELTFQSENAEQMEIGMKGTLLDGRFSYDVDIFQLEFPNLQISVLSPDPEQTSESGNAGQRVRGIEFNTRFAATEHLRLGFAGAIMDGEMTRFPGAGCTPAEIAEGVNNGAAPCQFFDDGDLVVPADVDEALDLLAIINRTGLPAPRTPDWKFVLTADYAVPFGNDYEFTANAKSFISDGYITDVEGFTKTVSYDTHEDLNVQIGIRNLEKGWSIAAFARNIFEARPTYFAELDAFPDGTESAFLAPSAFTSFGIKFEYLID